MTVCYRPPALSAAALREATRAARPRVSHTAKRPERCPHCGGAKLVRKGVRVKKLETVQLWQCRACDRRIHSPPVALRNKTYPLRVILDGVTFYNLGYTLAQAAAKLKTRHGTRVAPSPGRMDRRTS